MLIPSDKYNFCVDPAMGSQRWYHIKIWFNDSLDLMSISNNFQTYGIMFDGFPQDFLTELERSDVSSRTVYIDLYQSLVSVPFDLSKLNKSVIFADEGNQILRMFLK